MSDLSYSLEAGETAYLSYTGIHSLRVTIIGLRGSFELAVSENFARPKQSRTRFLRAPDKEVFEIGDDASFRYLVYAKTAFSEGRKIPLVWLDGTALRRNRSDETLVSRISVKTPDPAMCDITYRYGWGVILEGEPFVERRTGTKQ